MSERILASRITARTWHTASCLSLELERPEGFRFNAGQSIRVLPDAQGRDYSLCSSPGAARLELYLRVIEGGVLSPFLASAPTGSSLSFSGPHGTFLFRGSPRPAVLVATGTGIAPFLSMARAGVGGFTLLHGVRSASELFGAEVVRAAAARYVPCLTGDAPVAAGEETAFSGRVTAWIAGRLAPGSYDFYLCGGRAMVRDVMGIVDDRFPDSRVYTEIFY
jgi:benzoate/toluate 1,2-dioxygenase reductase component